MFRAPSLGRIAHYVLPSGEEAPAIVTRVNSDGTVNLAVFNDEFNSTNGHNRVSFHARIRHRDAAPSAASGDTWHWPEIVLSELLRETDPASPETASAEVPAGSDGSEPEPMEVSSQTSSTEEVSDVPATAQSQPVPMDAQVYESKLG